MAYSDPLRDKLRQPSDLPSGFSFEEMEEGIRNKMAAPEKKKRRFFWLWLVPVFLGCSALYWMSYHSETILQPEKKSFQPLPDKKIKTDNSTEKEVKNSSPVVSAESKNDFHLSKFNQNKTSKQHIDVVTNSVKDKTLSNYQNTGKSVYEQGNHSEIKGKTDQHNTENQTSEEAFYQNLSFENHLENNEVTQQNTMETQPTPAFEDPVFLSHTLTEFQSNLESPVLPKISVAGQSLWKWGVEAGGGFLYWNLKNKIPGILSLSDHQADININPLFGWVSECRVNAVYKKKYFINFGLATTNMLHSFVYDGIKTTESISQTPEIVTIETNVLTGRVTEVYGISSQSVSTTRKVRSINRDFYLRVPVSVGYVHKKHQWSFFAGGGGAFIMFGRQEGKTLAFGEIVEYQKSHPLQNNVNWQWEIEGKVAYHFTPEWNIGLSIRYFSQNQTVQFTDQNASETFGFFPMILLGKSLN